MKSRSLIYKRHRIRKYMILEACRKIKKDKKLLYIIYHILNKKDNSLREVQKWQYLIGTHDLKKIMKHALSVKNIDNRNVRSMLIFVLSEEERKFFIEKYTKKVESCNLWKNNDIVNKLGIWEE